MKKFIALVAPSVLLMGLGLDLYIPVERIMMHELRLDFIQMQWTLTIYMYVFGLGQLIAGPISDWLGRKRTLIFSILIYAIGSLLMTQTKQFYLILAARACEAFGACGAMVCALALCRDTYEGSIAIRAFTYVRGIGSLAPILAPSLGVYFALTFGWHADFYFLFFFSLIAIVCALFLPYPTQDPKQANKVRAQNTNLIDGLKSVLGIITHRAFIKYAICAAMIQGVMFGYFSSSAVVYLSLLKTSEFMFALLFSINAFAFLCVAFGFANWMSKIGIDKSIAVGALCILTAGTFMLVLQYTLGLSIVTMFLPCLLASGGCAFALGASCTGALAPFKLQSGKAAATLGCIEFMSGGFLGALLVSNPLAHTVPIALYLAVLGCIMLLALRIRIA